METGPPTSRSPLPLRVLPQVAPNTSTLLGKTHKLLQLPGVRAPAQGGLQVQAPRLVRGAQEPAIRVRVLRLAPLAVLRLAPMEGATSVPSGLLTRMAPVYKSAMTARPGINRQLPALTATMAMN